MLDLKKILESDINQAQIKFDGISNYIIVYGAGLMGEYLIRILRGQGIEPIVCDSSENKIGEKILGIEIKNFSDIVNMVSQTNYKWEFIIGSLNYYSEIEKKITQSIPNACFYKVEAKVLFPEFYFSVEKIRELLCENERDLYSIYNALEDELSKENMVNLIKGHYTGDRRYFKRLTKDEQYFPDFMSLSDQEVFVDAGAYRGESLEKFIEVVKHKYKKVYCFEPSKENFNRLKDVSDELENEKIVIFNNAVLETNKTVYFEVVQDNLASSKVSVQGSNTEEIEAVAIDQATDQDATYIKMDIEGSELPALMGAKKTILKNRSKLAICIYHKYDDILTIPMYIMSLGLDYKYYIRHHEDNANEYVFYAV